MGQKVASIRSKMLLPPVQWFGGLDGSSLGFWKQKVFLESTPAWPLCWCAMAAQKVSSFYPSTEQNLVFGVTMNHILCGLIIVGFTIVLIVLQFGVMGWNCQPFVSYCIGFDHYGIYGRIYGKPLLLIWGQKGCARRHAKKTCRDAKM